MDCDPQEIVDGHICVDCDTPGYVRPYPAVVCSCGRTHVFAPIRWTRKMIADYNKKLVQSLEKRDRQ